MNMRVWADNKLGQKLFDWYTGVLEVAGTDLGLSSADVSAAHLNAVHSTRFLLLLHVEDYLAIVYLLIVKSWGGSIGYGADGPTRNDIGPHVYPTFCFEEKRDENPLHPTFKIVQPIGTPHLSYKVTMPALRASSPVRFFVMSHSGTSSGTVTSRHLRDPRWPWKCPL